MQYVSNKDVDGSGRGMETPADSPDVTEGSFQQPLPAPPRADTHDQLVDNLSSLWRRAGALTIDALVGVVIAVPIALVHPSLYSGATFGGPSLGFTVNDKGLYLTGIPLFVTILAWLAYMIVMEAAVGASLGKLLVGIRVVTVEGRRPSWRPAVVRTAMRIVDALPLFYLIGWIVALRSPTRQRLGDRVAGTLVVMASAVLKADVPTTAEDLATEATFKPDSRAAIIGLMVTVLGVSGYLLLTRPSAGTFDRYGIAFTYPPSWSKVNVEIIEAGGPPIFSERLGYDPENFLQVSGYHLPQPVTPENEADAEAEFSSFLSNFASQLRATEIRGPESTTVDGWPALRFAFTFDDPNGVAERFDARILLVGQTEYVVSCQYTSERAHEMQAGCVEAWRTIRAG